ncbi:D-alanine--D-alanine ligase family protein [Bradyrhizobium sp. CCBAU 45389]|uniref:D-alanine--D-alanine ligase family protein n=1 Tax=Bradyrhizobium sp. CCBAU 45389 TaxID=858429 RepID=UPI0023061AC2|nr:D-alanine--D-alanine ligase family protein [Bradyrhizobium sp. CCBAU 45389]MDA9404590.1 D-alanine--D-alanine ligase [Bradyrhizobium sp. CCBAU 45389]
MAEKIRVVVLYGGRSGEHEVSLKSAASVFRHLDRTRFEVIPVSIDKEGRWQWNDLGALDLAQTTSLPILPDAPEIRLAREPDGRVALMPISAGTAGTMDPLEIDVVFPVIHGPLCEDGTVQGLLELADVAYVGSGVLASAVSMDKDVAKRLAEFAGIPVAPYRVLTRKAFVQDRSTSLAKAAEGLSLPVFVKPCNMGSSVGIHKVKTWEALGAALDDAFRYDVKVLVEQGIDAREIEVAVLEGETLFASLASELNPNAHHEFYSYEAKYLDPDGARVDLPANLDAAQMERVRSLATQVFAALECSGFARVDFFLDRQGGEFCFNEINTLPGFTSISMYPKMMEASGVPYGELLTRLVELALDRHRQRQSLERGYAS